MKLTKTRLKQIIREEIQKLNEGGDPFKQAIAAMKKMMDAMEDGDKKGTLKYAELVQNAVELSKSQGKPFTLQDLSAKLR